MPADLLDRAAAAVDVLTAAGADDAWATATQSRDVEFSFRDGKLETVKDATSQSLAVQVFANGRYSTHQTTDLHPDRLASLLNEAIAITRALEPDDARQITPAELFASRPDLELDLVDDRVKALDREQRMAWCGALDEVARDHERVISVTSAIYDGMLMQASASSNGFSGSIESTYCWLGSSVTLADRGDRRAADSFFAGSPHVGDLPDTVSVAGIALDRALARLDADKGPSLKTTMVVDSRAAAQLVSRLVGSANARSVQQGRSFWAGIMGEPAFSPLLTIIDDPLIVRGLASRPYDSEGISSKLTPLVEEGVARNIYVDTYYGRKAGMTPTTGTPSNLRVTPGDRSLEQLLGYAGEGIYVTSWLGGNADGTTGDFSLGLRGHVIENGAIGRPVSEMNVTGNLKDLFARLEAVGNDPYPYAATLAPSLLFSDVHFAGA